jgi:hypothetical protein
MMDDSMYAVAEGNITYIYDSNGKELHRSSDLKNTRFLNYLPYHFLLACVVIYKNKKDQYRKCVLQGHIDWR